MKIDREVVHSIIRLQFENYENTSSTPGVISILIKATFRKISKPPLTGNLNITASQKNNHYGQNTPRILIIILLQLPNIMM